MGKKEILRLALILSIILFASVFSYYLGSPHREIERFSCDNGTRVETMWNDKLATEFNITSEQISNMTYAYLYDYEIDCPEHIEDCFISVPVERCCYQTDNYLYCRTQAKDKINDTLSEQGDGVSK